jgi:hypothetical protein
MESFTDILRDALGYIREILREKSTFLYLVLLCGEHILMSESLEQDPQSHIIIHCDVFGINI